MFSLQKNWFTPHGPTPSWRESFPSFQDLTTTIDREIRRSLAKDSKRDDRPVDLKEIQFVLERSAYEKLQQTYEKLQQTSDKQFVQPLLVYHSTQNIDKVNGIVKHGYLLPGQQHPTQLWTLRMQNGNMYGDGIYCSPVFDVSRWYSFLDLQQDIQLIVNILLPGRTLVSSNTMKNAFMGPVDSDGHDPGVYWRYMDDKKDPYRVDDRVDYHTIRSKDMNIWVCGCPDRLIPVAVVTVRPRPHSPLMRPFAALSRRRLSLRQNAVAGSCVKFSYFGAHLSLVTPAHKSSLYASYYSNPYTLLVGTVIRQHYVDVETMRELMKWFTSRADTPAAFLSLPRINGDYYYSGEPAFSPICPEMDDCRRNGINDVLEILSQSLVDKHGGLVPRTFESIERLPGVTRSAVLDFFAVVSADENMKKTFVGDPEASLAVHYFVVPPSLLAIHGFASRMNNLVNSIQCSRKTLAVCEPKLRVIPIRNNDTLLQTHREYNDASSVSNNGDSLIAPLGQLMDPITEENDNERFVNVVYLFINKPNDLNRLDDFIHEWKPYLSLKYITVKLVFLDKVIADVCKLKSYLQTLPTESPNYFFEATSMINLEDVLNAAFDEVEYEQSMSEHSIQLAVSYPFGVIGEGFLKDVALQPSWEVHTSSCCLFHGAPPEFVTQSGATYKTSICDSPDLEDLARFSSCVFTLLAGYQAYMFQSQERIAAYGRIIEEMSQRLLEWMDKAEAAPSVLRGLRYKLCGFLSTMEAFGGVTFHGKWYANLREMKFGKQLSRRVAKEFNLEAVTKGVPFQDLKQIKEPSDALFFVSRPGRLVRVKTSNASQIEPWLIHVEYVSPDTDGSSLTMFRAAEKGKRVQDSRGRLVTDALLLDSNGDDEIAKLYYGYVFTRTPYLYLPSQKPSLLVNTMTTCIEKAFEVCSSYRAQGGPEVETDIVAKARWNLEIAMDLVGRVQMLMDTGEMRELIGGTATAENLEIFFTTQYGIQSVNQVLAALVLSQAAELTMSDRWPRICFGLLAEAVMRNCRARFRSGKKTADQLIDKALLIRHPDDTLDYKLNVRRSCRTTTGTMLHSFTNCSPYKVVAVLYFVKYLHQNKTVDEILSAFVCGEASMANFLRENLPGRGGYITQLALYLQGIYRMKAKYSQDMRFENPRAIVDDIVRERLHYYEVQRLHARQKGDRILQRREIRLAEAEIFRQYHSNHPTLFTVSEVEKLNKHRPPNDQLQLMQTGLLTHHCCYPHCPHYLQTFQTEKDEKLGTRNGLMKHLAADMLIGQYANGWHVQCRRWIRKCSSEEEFNEALKRHFPSLPDRERYAKAQYKQYKELVKKETLEM